MLKTELIERIAELETKLGNAKWQMDVLLMTASDLLYGKDNSISQYSINSNKISNTNQLFYEIWKLVEFKDDVLEQRNYERGEKNNQRELEYFRSKEREENK